MKKSVIWILCLGLTLVIEAEALNYRVSYFFQGDVEGVFLFVFPFRVFFEISASADFIAEKDETNRYAFSFDKIVQPGYLFRSLGFRGRQFIFLAAGYEPERTLVFSIEKIEELVKNNPNYAPYMINTRKVLFPIPPDQQGSMAFERSHFGIHDSFVYNFRDRTDNQSEKNGVFFNIYPILIELLKAFDHSCIPVSNLNELDSRTVWRSPPLDLTDTLNRVGWNAARIMKKFIVFRQSRSFRINYRVTSPNGMEIEICGEAHPDVKVWGGFKIRDVYRRVRFGVENSVLISDEVSLEVRNNKNAGGFARVLLKLME